MLQERSRTLRRQGYSIGQIARTLKVSKSSVYWHVHDIQLTPPQQAALKRQKHHLMIQVNAKRRGKPLRPLSFLKPLWSEELIHLVAHLSFDGHLDRYGACYYNRSYTQVAHVRSLMQRVLHVQPKLKQRVSGIWVMSIYNVELAAWLVRKEQQLLDVVQRHPTWQRQWLQAFFDDEGHVHVTKGIRRVRASQHRRPVLYLAKKLLETRGITSRCDHRAQAIEITGQRNLMTFHRDINFAPGLFINEHRKNGLWKQPLEKRQLLKHAINSYQFTTAL